MAASDAHAASGPGAAGEEDMDRYRALHAEALQKVEYCLSLVPIQCLSEVDQAERALNRLRDSLILGLRKQNPPGPPAVLRAALDQANVALSLVVGVEYPATGSQRKPLEMARDALQAVRFENTG